MLHPQKGLTRSNHVKLMLRSAVIVSLIPMSLISFSGCEKKSGQAIVLAKEHIDAALPNPQTPNPQSEPSPNVEFVRWRMMRLKLMATMKPEMRDTSRDPRACSTNSGL